MKIFRLCLLLLGFCVLGTSQWVHADDIDIYAASAANTTVPNVLFVLDSGANFESDATACNYSDGTGQSSLSPKAGGIEQCALVDAINSLPEGTVNIGLMTFNGLNYADTSPAAGSDAWHELCVSNNDSGCLLRKLTFMNAAGKASLVKFIKSWSFTTSDATHFKVKGNLDHTAAAMQEAWAYYNGKVGLSTKDYGAANSVLNSGCQKNFVIFIGNSFSNSSTPGDNGTDPYSGTNALTSTQVGATADQKVKIVETVSFKAKTCGETTYSTTKLKADNWADEWARLMFQQDGSTGVDGFGGTQNITTYTIGVIDNSGDNTCRADYPALLSSMAEKGGGKYFQTGNAAEVTEALNKILNEIQAVNSVFASASLPVSVNAQGTYLNQIFLGMFRPDAGANPRWLGNLKQYKFILSGANPSTATLQLGDASTPSAPALSTAGTGFLSPAAISFWTYKDTNKAPDDAATGGFYVNEPNPVGHDHFDLPDGELVERGAVAQQLRKENLKANFSATAGSTENPRRLYTYCPSGSACKGDLTDPSNAFSTANVAIGSTAFGDSTAIRIDPTLGIKRTGSIATITTTGNHGFVAGTTSVEIRGATKSATDTTSESAYNVTKTVATVPTSNTFTFTGMQDFPNSPSKNAYIFSVPGGSPLTVSDMTRTTNGTPTYPVGYSQFNAETVQVTIPGGHPFTAGSTVTIAGAVSAFGSYNGDKVISLPGTVACPAATCFTYEQPITPSKSVSGFSAVVVPPATSISLTSVVPSGNGGIATVTTSTAHGFHVGQIVRFSNVSNQYNGIDVAVLTKSDTTFTFTGYANGAQTKNNTGTVAPTTTAQIISLSRAASTDSETVTANLPLASANVFGRADGDVKYLNITKAGATSGELAYQANNVKITCKNTGCTNFIYGPIATSPSNTITGTITASIPSAVPVTIAAANITRGTTYDDQEYAYVTGATANVFGNAIGATKTVNVTLTGADAGNESAYLGIGTWTITCTTANCSGFKFGPVKLDPLKSAATATKLLAIASGTAPAKDPLIKWVRGEDNFGDELGPHKTIPAITVRPSIHGDVLHSRPVVVNYGDADPTDPTYRGLVVFYGSNGGAFHAVNGSQTDSIGTVPPGGELWGLVLPEHFAKLNRQRVNSPEIKLSVTSSALSDALPKDYFVDGSVGSYQKLKADGSIDKAYLYLTMRRGGQLIYALDVSNPKIPKFVWKIDTSGTTSIDSSDVQTTTLDSQFSELGQTWSRPRLTLVNGYANPVLIFGAGYDNASQDAEPPGSDSMGRGIYVVDAVTGLRVWSVTYGAVASCGVTNACVLPEMKWSIPSDITFVDRDNDGKTDRLYVGDVGGNVWRVDLEPVVSGITYKTPDKWKVTKLAALGCTTGAGPCTVNSPTQLVTTPRKFFYPPNVVPVGATSADDSYDAVMIGSGDREHPLMTSQSYSVIDRFYVLKDTTTGMTASGSLLTEASLMNGGSVSVATCASSGVSCDVAPKGFYKTFSTGEKSVNASVTLRGTTYFGTNAPKVPIVTDPPTIDKSCKSNLGIAKGYALDPFKGTFGVTEFDGGGLPPSPTSGIVTLLFHNTTDNTYTPVKKEFCVGCGGGGTGTGADARSSLGAVDPARKVPKSLRRTYWYKK